jgi:hypothetical protein
MKINLPRFRLRLILFSLLSLDSPSFSLRFKIGAKSPHSNVEFFLTVSFIPQLSASRVKLRGDGHVLALVPAGFNSAT